MGNDWIVDVLADLRSFAQQNELKLLAVQLEQTALVAKAEISEIGNGAPLAARGDTTETGQLLLQAGAGRRT